MFQKLFLVMALLIVFGGQAKAVDRIVDQMMRVHGLDCNGESDTCEDDYTQSVSLFDESNPTSPEVKFDVNNNHGKLDVEF